MSDLAFSCTQCGRCCHNHNLPLTIDEAVAWLTDGGKVDLYCDADLWPDEPPPDDRRAAHRRRRSFSAPCGASRVRVTVVLVASVSGPCRNLGHDFMCRIYERRPLVCRIYPAEINPFIELAPANKACPPEAWRSGPAIVTNGKPADEETRALIARSRQTDEVEAPLKKDLCRILGIGVTALAGEGFAIHECHGHALLAALRMVRAGGFRRDVPEVRWRLCSPWPATVDGLNGRAYDAVQLERPGAAYGYAVLGSGPTVLPPASARGAA
ncbi:MAG TPA: YkgJ family cysteine cluster protein [Alphaproteobacteria bacterium]